jgi:hypothetical protein
MAWIAALGLTLVHIVILELTLVQNNNIYKGLAPE